ncbi:MAG: monovalent cation/H(+) antiporter subunit G [Verrucomicrobiota bacterium]
MIISIVSGFFVVVGLAIFFGASVGLIRFPDFYSRTHAAGKGDTLSTLLVLVGLAIYQLKDFEGFAESWPILLIIAKLIAVSLFILITSPTSTHALMDAGWEDQVEPTIEPNYPNHLEDDYPQNDSSNEIN